MNQIIFIMKKDLGGDRTVFWHRYYNRNKAQRQHKGGNEELLALLGRRKLSWSFRIGRYAWTDSERWAHVWRGDTSFPDGREEESHGVWPSSSLYCKQFRRTGAWRCDCACCVHDTRTADQEITGWQKVKLESCRSQQRNFIIWLAKEFGLDPMAKQVIKRLLNWAGMVWEHCPCGVDNKFGGRRMEDLGKITSNRMGGNRKSQLQGHPWEGEGERLVTA